MWQHIECYVIKSIYSGHLITSIRFPFPIQTPPGVGLPYTLPQPYKRIIPFTSITPFHKSLYISTKVTLFHRKNKAPMLCDHR